MGPHPEQSFAAPLRDVENTWCPDGTHHLRLSGYMDHTPLEPYRYVSRGGMAMARVHVVPVSGTGIVATQRRLWRTWLAST